MTMRLTPSFLLALVAAAALAQVASAETSGRFAGAKANTGTATFAKLDGKRTLTVWDDFKVPDTPDPHWQIVDSTC